MKCESAEHVVYGISRFGNMICEKCRQAWYQNSCIVCKGPIDTRYLDTRKRCNKCNWFICPRCKGCLCSIEETSSADQLYEKLKKYDDPSSVVIIDDDPTNPYGNGCCSFCGMKIDGITHSGEYCPNFPDND